MPRISPLELGTAEPASKSLLVAVGLKMGVVPNVLKALAHSPSALNGYLSFHAALAEGTLSAALREQVALAVAGANGCRYCAAAHTALAKNLQVDEAELRLNLDGRSSDPATEAALSFVKTVIEKRGRVSDEELAQVREAGFTNGQIAELVAVIAVCTLTNYFDGIAQSELDFPAVEPCAT